MILPSATGEVGFIYKVELKVLVKLGQVPVWAKTGALVVLSCPVNEPEPVTVNSSKSILKRSVPPVEMATMSDPGLKKPVFLSVVNEKEGEAAVLPLA